MRPISPTRMIITFVSRPTFVRLLCKGVLTLHLLPSSLFLVVQNIDMQDGPPNYKIGKPIEQGIFSLVIPLNYPVIFRKVICLTGILAKRPTLTDYTIYIDFTSNLFNEANILTAKTIGFLTPVLKQKICKLFGAQALHIAIEIYHIYNNKTLLLLLTYDYTSARKSIGFLRCENTWSPCLDILNTRKIHVKPLMTQIYEFT